MSYIGIDVAKAQLEFACRPSAETGPAKVALTACMRKLLVILNAMARRGTPWQPEHTLART
jgi:transposase